MHTYVLSFSIVAMKLQQHQQVLAPCNIAYSALIVFLQYNINNCILKDVHYKLRILSDEVLSVEKSSAEFRTPFGNPGYAPLLA